MMVLDVECYPNYFMVAFKDLESGELTIIDEMTPRKIRKLQRIMKNNVTFGFNSIHYDIPMITGFINKYSNNKLYELSKSIIENNLRSWQHSFRQELDNVDHFDIKEPSPAVMISLKLYGTRIGSKKLWDLPYDPHVAVTEEEQGVLRNYCENDLDVTIDLYKSVEDRIRLREVMSQEYGIDLRSKSDAQIAEAVICNKVNYKGRPPVVDYVNNYEPPKYVKFESVQLQNLLTLVQYINFELAANGAVKMPPDLAKYKIEIGSTKYKMGIGGLHSQEKQLVVESNDDNIMMNADFASYYPFIIIKNKYYPQQMGMNFLNEYEKIVRRRLKAKEEGDKLVADSLKITINGSFGKLGSKYSKLYAPDLMLQVTITGQLTLLMLIEQFEKHGIPVVSANTDGLEYFCPRDKVELSKKLIRDLELLTGYEMDVNNYQGLYARDVNNYVAKYDGYVKAKGVFVAPGLSKNRQVPVCFAAVREHVLTGQPIDNYIINEKDMNQFVSARTVKGGGVWKEQYLGKVVRWYYSTNGESIHYKTNNNKVPLSDGAKPMMDLSDDIPSDLDYDWYIAYAKRMLKELGL